MRLAFLLLLAFATSAFGEIKPPGFIVNGLTTYFNYGSKEALGVWLQGSPVVNTGFQEKFAAIENQYGKMIGSETINVTLVSSSVLRVYMLIKYERGPAFVLFECYKPNDAWFVTRLDFDTRLETILPERLFLGNRK